MNNNTIQTTILIVDDDVTLLQTMQIWFELKKFKALAANGAFEAIKILESRPVDLILSDVRMPQGNGIDLLNWIKDSGLPTPVLLMSGFSDLTAEQALDNGAKCLLGKPLDTKNLLEIIQRHVQKV